MIRILPILMAALFALSLAPPAASAAEESGPEVATTAGRIRGHASADGVRSFKGVPFAAPPTGVLRWKPPAPPAPWPGVRESTAFGPACQQRPGMIPAEITLSEDCLTTNVWTAASGTRKPVMVFIHGGGFVEGSAAEPTYDGTAFARDGVVLVTLQYRLGPFGYLDLSALGPDYADSANNAVLDQIAGLRWVRDNIAEFGGDPGNVTLFGESAGAISVAALQGSPLADGLYHRTILESGTAANVSDTTLSAKVSSQYQQIAGQSTPDGLRALSTEQAQNAANELYETEFADTAFGPVAGNRVLPAHPLRRLAAPESPKVPTLITTNRDEARYWLKEQPDIDQLPERFFRPWLENLVGADHADAATAAYRAQRPDLTEGQLGLAMVGDVAFRAPAVRTAETLAHQGVPTWIALFTVTSPKLDGRLGSPHAIELPYVFDTLAADPEFTGTEPWKQDLAHRVHNLWVSFAKTGTPAHPDWRPYDTTHRATLVIDQTTAVVNDPLGGERAVFAHLPYDGTRPTLDDITPLQFPGTPWYHPAVVIALLGPGWTITILVGMVAVLVGAFAGIRRLRRRSD